MYERLTKRCDLGLDKFEEICFINPDDVDGMYTLDEIVDAGRYETRLAIADRLAAYEDSGLSPEDCAAYAKGEAEKRIVVFESYEHMQEIRELIQAKADGRLVVLPCKVGDTVYAYDDVFNQIAPYKVDMIQLYGHSSMSFCANWRKGGELMADLDFDKADIGKTVFLTREAAEKAIAEVMEE